MIEAFGLTSNPRKAHRPAVDDVSFEARAGHVTALQGGVGAGKTTALRLMLELQQGHGITYFRGRPLHRIAHPTREVGLLLGDVPGHPARSVRGHLRMLCAASGVPARRADEVLEVVGLAGLRDERLGALSRGMDRRLGLACALLPDPHTLVLDDPAEGLSTGEAQWLHDMLRAHAEQGGTVLFTTADPKEAARAADRVVTLDGGRLRADQDAEDFARTRLRPRVAVRSPHAARLAALLTKEARTARRSVQVVREGGNLLSVYGSTTADIGETAFRNGILVHQLADEVGDMVPTAGAGSDSSSQGAGEVAVDESRARCAPDAPGASVTPGPETSAPDLPAAESGTSAFDSSAPAIAASDSPGPRKAAVSFGFSSNASKTTASGVVAEARGATSANFPVGEGTAVDGPTPESAISGRYSREDAQTVSALAAGERRARAADGELPTFGEVPCLRSDALAEIGWPGGALPGADGAAHGVVSPGRQGTPDGSEGAVPAELLAGAGAGRTADVTASRPSQGTVAAARELQAGGASSSAAGISALRARLPGARNPSIRRPRTARADQPAGVRTLDALCGAPRPPRGRRRPPAPPRGRGRRRGGAPR
ncbi:ATP-binding cassette domain-containing protein, partial [Streptomyces broussonetiae]|uniref:ATP-binding cassette domain-containing protein n=1 Tax=Streptomyces broussonetiae TaxID=2686304 RepID=UPI0035E2FD32